MNDLERLKLRLARFPLQTLRSKEARPTIMGKLLLAGWKEAVLNEHVDEALAWARSAAQAEAQKKEVARRLAKKEKK